jgi:uncharacterized membrane protein (DUF485 family)
MPRALIVEILGDATQFAKELDRAAGKTRQLGKVAGVAGLALGGALALGLEKSAKVAMEAQSDQARLTAALKSTHQSVAAMTPILEEAEGAARKLGFSDNDTRLALAKLEAATGSTEKAVTDLGIAQGIARLKQVDMQTATQMLTGSMAGNTRAAKALGIILMPVTTHMDALKARYQQLGTAIPIAERAQARLQDKMATGAAAIQQVSDKVRGQKEAFANTAQGGIAKFQANVQHLEETLGNALLPTIGKVAGALAHFADFLARHRSLAKALAVAFGAVAFSLIGISVAAQIMSVGVRAALISSGIGIAILAIGVAAELLITHWSKVKVWFEKFWGWLKIGWRVAVDAVEAIFFGWLTYVTGILKSFMDVAASAFGWLPKIGPKLRAATRQVDAWFAEFKQKALKAGKDIGAALAQGTKDGWTSAVAEQVLSRGNKAAASAAAAATTATAHTAGGGTSAAVVSAAQAAARQFAKVGLPFKLKLEQAKAELSGSHAALIKAARDTKAYLTSVMPFLKGDNLLTAIELLKQANDALVENVKTAKKVVKKVAKKVTDPGFVVPMRLQLAAAKAAASTTEADDIKAARAIKQYAMKALRSGHLSLAAQKDAWDAITQANQELTKAVKGPQLTGVVASAESLTKGIAFATTAARRAEEGRIAQALAHGGHTPSGLGVLGQNVTTVHTHVHLDGQQIAHVVDTHNQRRAKHRPVQVRGPHAGRS